MKQRVLQSFLGLALSACFAAACTVSAPESDAQSIDSSSDRQDENVGETAQASCAAHCWTECSSDGVGWTKPYLVPNGSAGNCIGKAYEYCYKKSHTYDHAKSHWGCSF